MSRYKTSWDTFKYGEAIQIPAKAGLRKVWLLKRRCGTEQSLDHMNTGSDHLGADVQVGDEANRWRIWQCSRWAFSAAERAGKCTILERRMKESPNKNSVIKRKIKYSRSPLRFGIERPLKANQTKIKHCTENANLKKTRHSTRRVYISRDAIRRNSHLKKKRHPTNNLDKRFALRSYYVRWKPSCFLVQCFISAWQTCWTALQSFYVIWSNWCLLHNLRTWRIDLCGCE